MRRFSGVYLGIISIAIALVGLGFILGQHIEKKHNLEQCKLAGWEFIDEIFYKPNPKTKEYVGVM